MVTLRVLCLIGIFFQPYSSGTTCASFKFPDLNNSVFEAKENDTIKLKFQLENWQCTGQSELTITIRKKDRQGKYWDVCTIRDFMNSCIRNPSGSQCGCLPEGGYQLTTTFNKTAHGMWLWTAQNEKVQDKELTFNIRYPATVHNVSITTDASPISTDIVEPGTPVTVNCYWENGNPPVHARVLNRHEKHTDSSVYETGRVRLRFEGVDCEDAGLIRCQAPGASHNGTARLLVKCAPDIKNSTNTTANLGEPFDLTFPVRAHTTELSNCTLVPPRRPVELLSLANNSTSRDNEMGICFLTGTPPDLRMTVRLHNVTADDVGLWRLELTNDAGKGRLDFNLYISDGRETTPSVFLTFFKGMTLKEIVIFAAVGTVVVGIICIVIVVACKRKASRRRMFLRPNRTRRAEEDVILSVGPFAVGKAGGQKNVAGHGSDHYNNIDDLPPPPPVSRRSDIEEDGMTEDSSMRRRADTNNTFLPHRPPSDNFRITRIGRRLMHGLSSRASRMTYE